jgi:flagellar biosynthesis protein
MQASIRSASPLIQMKSTEQRSAAVALASNDKVTTPRVTAKGSGLVAESIIRRARDAGIYVHESPALVALLMRVDLDTHIPPKLYTTVAELLVWLYKIDSVPGTLS